MIPDFDETLIRSALHRAWSLETARQWRERNPALGQCNVTAAVVHDLWGGEVLRTWLPDVWHYYNRIGGKRYDFTDGQFFWEGAMFAPPDPYEDDLSSRGAALETIPEREYTALRAALIAAF